MCALMWSLIRVSFALIKPGFKTYQRLNRRNLTQEEMRGYLKYFTVLCFFLYFDFITYMFFSWVPLMNIAKTIGLFIIFNEKNEIYITIYDDIINPTFNKSESRIILKLKELKKTIKEYSREKLIFILKFLLKMIELTFKNIVMFALAQYKDYKEKNPSKFNDVEFFQNLTQWYYNCINTTANIGEFNHQANASTPDTATITSTTTTTTKDNVTLAKEKEIDIPITSSSSTSIASSHFKFEKLNKKQTFNSTETAVNEIIDNDLTELEMDKRKLELKELREQIREEKEKLLELIKQLDYAS